MKQVVFLNAAVFAMSAISLAAWAQAPATPSPQVMPEAVARATLKDADKLPIGSLEIFEGKKGLLIRLDAAGLKQGWHGFHFHQKGTCDDSGFKGSGDHMAHGGSPHGILSSGPHIGDLPNIYASADGIAKVDIIAPGLTLKGSDGLLDKDGTAIIIHANADDYQSQPSGAAGDRIACGVIEAASASNSPPLSTDHNH